MIGLGWGGAWVDEVTCEMEPAQDKQAGIRPRAGADPVTFVLAGWSWFCVFTLAGVAYSSWAVSFATGPPAGFLVLGGGAAILGTYAEYALTTAAFLVFLVRRRWAWAAQLLPAVSMRKTEPSTPAPSVVTVSLICRRRASSAKNRPPQRRVEGTRCPGSGWPLDRPPVLGGPAPAWLALRLEAEPLRPPRVGPSRAQTGGQ